MNFDCAISATNTKANFRRCDAVKAKTSSLEVALADDKFQFERHGYFVADRKDHVPGKPVFNLGVGLKDSWGR